MIMNTTRSITANELKDVTKMKRLAQALSAVYARLVKRTWRIGEYRVEPAGINWEQDYVLFSYIANAGENSATYRYWRTPIAEAIDCLSGDLQPHQVERRA